MTSLVSPTSANAAANAASAAASSTANKSSSSGSAGSGSAATLTQADFLQLLTAQLKYQSPSNPADPTQMASEFAAISTVEGINSLNTKLSALSTTAGTGQVSQASALIGKQVAIVGNALTPNAAGGAEGAFNLAAASASTDVTILNPNGSVADTLTLGPLSPGQQNFSWSGAQAGTSYTYNVTAADGTGAPVTVTPYSVYTVTGVNVSGGTPTLNVVGTADVLPISSVQTIIGAPS